MKKLIYGVSFLAIVGIVIVGCSKENITPISLSGENEATDETGIVSKGLPGTVYKTEIRKYVWINEKMDCSQVGSGCEVGATLTASDGDVIDLSLSQILKLIEVGNNDLNQAFKKNQLRFEFPSLYKQGYITSGISTGQLKVRFTFPYLTIENSAGNVVKAYNYESTIDNPQVKAAIQGNGYTKKVEFNSDPNKPVVWKCKEPGDNCKVKSVRFNTKWLKDNPSWFLAPISEPIVTTEIEQDGTITRIIGRTISGKKFGIEY
tara:strand:+ start:40241 stop:41026 length:786 start_codon:yes stop_codon:yes gene_type:complete